MNRMVFLLLGLSMLGCAQLYQMPMVESFQSHEAPGNEATDIDYQKGLSELDTRQWQASIAHFQAAAKRNKSLMDAALYWQAYALTRAGQLQQSLEAIKRLEQNYPDSRWVKDARALALEIDADAGHPANPASETDEDLKLLALNTLMQDDAKAGTDALVQIMNGGGSEKTKEHALFVLSQSESPEAKKALMDMARRNSNPKLQMAAVRMMGMMGGDPARAELAGLYTSSSNPALKHEILNGMMLAGSKSTLLRVARTEPDPGLRNSAITNLSLTGGQAELSELYKSGAPVGVKKQILNLVFMTGDTKMLMDVVQHEKDNGLRVAAIHSLGTMPGHGAALTKVFQTETNDEIRRAVLDALVMAQDGATLGELAQAEKDDRMKAEILTRLAVVSGPHGRPKE